MFKNIVASLDNVANDVESNGLLKEAEELDIIANTIEKMAKVLPAGKDRPAAIFPAEHPKVKDKNDHFPIPDKAHGQNALARVNQYSAAPDWWKGSLEELKNAVYRAVKGKFPGMKVEK
jgi:transcriptional regulator of aromatic amino acid metabolism